ncbi:carbohydrate porin [Bradyrhizobium sp. JR3.5]
MASASAFPYPGTGLSIGGGALATNSQAFYTNNIYASGTVRGRIGYAPGNWLFYATGGLAWTTEQFSLTQLATDSHFASRLGWAAGVGVEAPLIPNWTARVEYLYTSYGNSSTTFPSTGQQFNSNLSEQMVRLGLNFQFGEAKTVAEKNAPKSFAGIDPDRINIHGEFTGIWQGYPAFRSPYEGPRSLSGGGQGRETTEAGLYLGLKLWQSAELWFNPEIDQGFGVGNTLGVAGYPSVGAFKLGLAQPYARVQHFFLRQTINLGGVSESVPEGFMNFAGTQSSDRVVLTVGRFSAPEIFDTNKYLPLKSGFLNWSFLIALPYDFGGDAWTPTYGAAPAEWYVDRFAVRVGAFDLSKTPQGGLGFLGYSLDPTFSQFNLVGEVEERHELWGQPGKLKFLAYINRGNMAAYSDAIAWGAANGMPPVLDAVRQYQTKPGFVINLEQQITPDLGFLAQVGWMNGRYEPFDTSDVDRTVLAGFSISGNLWGRPYDTIGVAGAVNGISKVHQAFLNAGGQGTLLGDGQLSYPSTEHIFETYYSCTLSESSNLTFDYQFIENPAYNTDRGPVNLFATRYIWHF